MKPNILLHLCRGLLMLALLGGWAAQAQGPTIDPTFQRTAVFKPASVIQAVQQPDGKRLVLGNSTRAGDKPAGALVRLLANSNEPDSVFTSNARLLQGQLRFLSLLPSGKVLLTGFGALTLGNVTREHLLCLNADGTPDASFNANIAPSTGFGSNPVINAVGQPDGKIVLVCNNTFPGSGSRLVRLLPTGAVDAAFQGALSNSVSGTTQLGNNVVLQADGKLVVPGTFGTSGVIRLLPTGALDTSFSSQLTVSATVLASQVAVQPDGKVLVTTYNNGVSGNRPLVRLTATGALDPTFQSAILGYFSTASPWSEQVQVQPDGKLVVSGTLTDLAGNAVSPLLRLLPGGGLDSSFDATATINPVVPLSTQLLPNGQILAVRTASYLNGRPLLRAILLNTNGSLNPSFAPRIYLAGQVNDVVQLAGGSYLVGGDFVEINGLVANNLARLSATGVPDPTFTVTADGAVRSLLVQPDGKLLVGGNFERIAGGSRVSVARLLPSGALDTGFAPPFLSTALSSSGGVARVALLPDGRVLTAGTTKLTSAGAPEYWMRVLDATTGQPDLTIPNYIAQDLVVQPNGKAVVAGFVGTGSSPTSGLGYCLFRLSPNGGLDPTFAPMPSLRTGLGGGPVISALTQDALGHLFFTSYSYTDTSPGITGAYLYHVLTDGGISASVQNTSFAGTTSLAVQPNGRVLVGADIGATTPTYGLSRVLNSLTPDPSFIRANGPLATVNRILVQPDGAILAAGSFTSAGGQAIGGLVRLLDANVLRVSNPLLAARTQAWPVPAHGQLHLALDAASRPQRVELLDALGRVALAQPAPQAALTLDTAPLAPGVYLLRVHYATSPMARRVVLE